MHAHVMFHALCASVFQGKDFCFGLNNEQYRCEMGYCCGETECCTYYYELWCKWQGLPFSAPPARTCTNVHDTP